jgi:hypothetical protein
VARPSGLPVALPILLAIVATACRHQASQRGPGVTAQGVAALRHGMSRDEVASILGPPLLEPPPGSAYRFSTYAQHGGWRVLGSHGTLFGETGLDLLLSFQDERLTEVLLINQHADAICGCVREHCKDDWASACLAAVQW